MNRILVTDDEQNHLKAIERIFNNTDCVMKFAQNGMEALSQIPKFKPDLIILDIMMPEMNGYDTCRKIKSDHKTADIMVLLLSAKNDLESRLTGYEAGADDYLIKPYDPEELKAKVNILMRLKRAQDDLRTLNQNLETVVQDRTRELVKKERQALIGQMVAGFIHNLRGPLTAAYGSAGLASLKAQKLEEILELNSGSSFLLAQAINEKLDDLLQALDKTKLLIDNLLIKSRNEAELKKQPLILNDVIVQEIEFLDTDKDLPKGVKTNLQLDPSLPEIHGIYSDFSQIIYNLAKNAMDAMRKTTDKELKISTRYDGDCIYLVFQDTGPGIDPENLERIFDPFFTTKPKGDSGNNEEPTGTGLGLYSCSQLLKYYDGTIRVESSSNNGAAFVVTIPRILSDALNANSRLSL